MGIKFKDRPKCSCGVKMKLERYKGYYDLFNYWVCDNCELDKDMQDEEADRTCLGSYA